MIKGLIVIVLLAAVIAVGNFIYTEYTGKATAKQKQDAAAEASGANLEGVPFELETSLQQAQAAGPAALKQWLDKNRRFCRDPRLASIELDYVMQLGRTNPSEAKKIFQNLRGRIRSDSPVYEKMKRIEPTFGR